MLHHHKSHACCYMKRKLSVFILLILCSSFYNSLFAQIIKSGNSWVITSPNGLNRVVVQSVEGRLFYSVLQKSDTVIKRSLLGIGALNNDFTQQLIFQNIFQKKIDEVYYMLTGKRRLNRNFCNESTLHFTNKQNTAVQIIVRAYNDGVAFRYRFPGVNGLTINKEITSFTIPGNGKAWLMPYGHPADWSPAYENNYTNGSAIDESSPDSTGWAFPALFHSNNNFILITESDLDTNFYGSHLAQDCSNGQYKITHPLAGEAYGLYKVTATSSTAFSTPWRTIIFGKSIGTIIESNLVHHLASPNKIGDASWIKPGRSSWSWWGDHASSKDFSTLKKFIDLSKTMGWEYSLVDANWDIMEGGGTIEDLVKYANEQKIALTLWYNSGGKHTAVTERPRDIMSDPVKRKADFKKLNRWGVKAVKVDFFNSDKQELIKLYIDILKDAAAHKIMVVFHGCTLPRGWSRTYPNLLSMESVKGAEQYGWDSAFATTTPIHNITAMCTRNVVGSMDYTPVTFSSYDCCNHATSNAYELATAVLFESGMLHFADKIAPYMALDAPVKQFLKMVPVSWDDTRFLDGYPGKMMLMARRKGSEWFVAAANGEPFEKNLEVDLSFLPKGNYRLQIMKDGTNNRDIKTDIIRYTTGKPINVKLLPNGGMTIWVQKVS